MKTRYDQITLYKTDRKNNLQQILSPSSSDEGVWIYQNTWFYIGDFDIKILIEYCIKKSGNGVYVFILSVKVSINDQQLNSRDGFGVLNINKICVKPDSNSEILLMEESMR